MNENNSNEQSFTPKTDPDQSGSIKHSVEPITPWPSPPPQAPSQSPSQAPSTQQSDNSDN